jgi:outer membrane protein assembly factor BamB
MPGWSEKAQQPLSPRTVVTALAAFLLLAALILIVLYLGRNHSSTSSTPPAAPLAAGPLAPCREVAGTAPTTAATQTPADWTRFGYDAQRTSATAQGLDAATVQQLKRRRVVLDGVVDAAPLYLHAVRVGAHRRDVLLLTSIYGRTEALDAGSGRVLWRYTPPTYQQLKGSVRITNGTPLVDPSRSTIYTEAPDGCVRALSVNDGSLLWSTAVTLYPLREKLGTPLNEWHGRLVVTTGGYVGDQPPYQGHVVVLDARSGHILHVWSSLCSDRHKLFQPSSCPSSDSAIWGRNGAVIRPNGQILVATGNGPFDGKRDWGDSALLLSPEAKLLSSWTPKEQRQYEEQDVDIGSISPAIVSSDLVLQGGKDGHLRLLRLTATSGRGRLGGELQTISSPGAGAVRTAPATWRHAGKVLVFVGDDSGLDAWRLEGQRLVKAWSSKRPATSPVVAGGLLYAFDPSGGLAIYRAGDGQLIRVLPSGIGHWQSPIVAGGRVYLTEGSGNDHLTQGFLDIYSSSG